jgi:hypothetical protein
MSNKVLKIIFLVFAILLFLVGLPLLLAPGRFLGMVTWAPVDPLLSRLLGAALLAMSWGSFLGFLATEPDQVRMLVSCGFVFSALGALGFARHLFTTYYYPPVVWVIFILLAAWAVLWGVVWLILRKR